MYLFTNWKQTQKTNLWLQKWKWGGWNKLGVQD